MWMIIILLVLAIVVLLVKTQFQRCCIKELKISKSNLMRKHPAEILDLMYILRDILSNYSEPASRDTQIRNFINDNIEKYSEMYRKKELNITATNENV